MKWDGNGILWTSSVEYYDIENGMQITKDEAKKMIKIRTSKQTKINNNGTKGHITYYAEYKRRNQLNIKFPDNT